MEILVSLILVTLVAGGTLVGFMLAGRVSQESVNDGQAIGDATRTIERFRNRVAADDTTWPTAPPLDPLEPIWNDSYSPFLDPALDPDGDADRANRQYTVTPVDIGGLPGPEYYRVTVNVHYDEPSP